MLRRVHAPPRARVLAAICALLFASPAQAAEAAEAELGIASQYPGDAGLGQDARVLVFEDFELSSTGALKARWSDLRNEAGLELVSDTPSGSAGVRSLRITARGGSDEGGHLFRQLPEAPGRLYFRYYVKYEADNAYRHSGLWLGGYAPAVRWPQGGAGQKPKGDERFSIGFEPRDAALQLDFYNYWMGMRGQGGRFFGNHLLQDSALRATPGRWTCVEIMVAENQPVEASNGELALWIDGESVRAFLPGIPYGSWESGGFRPSMTGEPFEGFRWRRSESLGLNFVWLQHYATGLSAGQTSRLHFDQVVVATEYVGPIVAPR